MTRRVKILVFGTSNVGKTSIINLLAKSEREIGHGARGCTFKSEECHADFDGVQYSFYDTAGLNEGDGDPTKESKEAIEDLIDLLAEIRDGFHLIIYVRRISALTKLDKQNYDLIKTLTNGQIPCICVNTGAENIDPINKWWEDHKNVFERAEYNFKDGLSVCTVVGTKPEFERIYKILREQSELLLWSCIMDNRLDEPIAVIQKNSEIWTKLLTIIDTVWNWKIPVFNIGLTDVTGEIRDEVVITFKRLLRDHNFDDNKITKIVNKMYLVR